VVASSLPIYNPAKFLVTRRGASYCWEPEVDSYVEGGRTQLLSCIACGAMIELFTSFWTGATITWPYRLSDFCQGQFYSI